MSGAYTCLANTKTGGLFHFHEECPVDEPPLLVVPIVTAVAQLKKEICPACMQWAKSLKPADAKLEAAKLPLETKDAFAPLIPIPKVNVLSPTRLIRHATESMETVCITDTKTGVFHNASHLCKLRKAKDACRVMPYDFAVREGLLPCPHCTPTPGCKPPRAALSKVDIDFVFNAPLPIGGVNIYLLDTEVCGSSDENKRIKELTIVELTNDRRLPPRCYTKYFKIVEPGYSKQQAKHGVRTFAEELPTIKRFINERKTGLVGLISHNWSFDARLIDREFRLAGDNIPDNWRFGDSLTLSRHLDLKPSDGLHTLGSLTEFWEKAVISATGEKDSLIRVPDKSVELSVHQWTPVMRALRHDCDLEIRNSSVSFHVSDTDTLALRNFIIFVAIWFGECKKQGRILTPAEVVEFVANDWKRYSLRASQCHLSASAPEYNEVVWLIIQRVEKWFLPSEINRMRAYAPPKPKEETKATKPGEPDDAAVLEPGAPEQTYLPETEQQWCTPSGKSLHLRNCSMLKDKPNVRRLTAAEVKISKKKSCVKCKKLT